jgi:hypothetical protein
MIRLKLFYFLLIFFFPAVSNACICVGKGVVDYFQESEFVAKAKIIKISPDPKNSDYHEAVIEVIHLYKGERLNKIKIMSAVNSSCRFLPVENATWIIFAQRWEGTLSFGFCSGSLDMTETFDTIPYPSTAKIQSNTIKLKEDVISFLSKKSIFNPNSSMLSAYNTEIESFKGYKNRNSFAVFQIDVNSNLSIAAIKQLKKFQNGKLNRLVFNSMKTKLTFVNKGEKPLAKSSRVILVCFFYQQRLSEQNFVTFNDL